MLTSHSCQIYTFYSDLILSVLARGGVLTAACVPLFDMLRAKDWGKVYRNGIASERHLLVQYAAPWEKKTEMSEPMSPAQSCSCASDAGRPLSSLAAHRAVAALALPPPSPAAAHPTPHPWP